MSRKKPAALSPPAADKSHLIALLLLAFYGLFLAHKINLVTADLGRHLKNGEDFFKTFSPLRTNYYSYTEPDFPVINHHWGSGAVFYLVWKWAGFEGLHVFFAAVSLATLWLFFDGARREAGAGLSALAGLLVLPLLAERTEIRPEAISYFLFAAFFRLLLDYRSERMSFRGLLLLPVLEALWVNVHIYFVFGPVLIGAFWLESWLARRRRPRDPGRLGGVLLLTAAAALLNPYGLKGALAPAEIFKNYGYRLVENQPVWFIEKLVHNPNFLIFKIVFALLCASFALSWRRGRANFSLAASAISRSSDFSPSTFWPRTPRRRLRDFGPSAAPFCAALPPRSCWFSSS